MPRLSPLPVINVVKLVTSALIAPTKEKEKGITVVVETVVEKVGGKVFLEAADNKDIGGIKVEVEGVVKKVVKANHHLTVTPHVPATFVTRRVIFRTAVHTQKNFN